jgi:hypothetical protein
MADWYNDEVPIKLVEFARKIAIHCGYPVLENGLQPVEDYMFDGRRQKGLKSKYNHELNDEFADAAHEATYSGGDMPQKVLHIYHEASDVLYYAACLDAQLGSDSQQYARAMFFILKQLAQRSLSNQYHITSAKIEAAALAKYAWRSTAPGNKNEQYELSLIEQTIR